LTAIAQHNHYIKTDFVPRFVGQGKRVSTVDQSTNFLIPGTTNIVPTRSPTVSIIRQRRIRPHGANVVRRNSRASDFARQFN
jgi:hypothetical protein